MNDTADQWVEMKCLEVAQPLGTFYVGTLKSQEMVRLAYADVRRIESEHRDVETYLGIERPLDPKRVAELKEYVRTVDASFPSSIIVAVNPCDTKYDSDRGSLFLRDAASVAKVLDGQHRIAGLDGYDRDDFQLVVTVFVDMDIENQAMLFATINLEQTKVNKSLAYDLFEYTKHPSPQKTAHDVVRLLDTKDGSPFKGKIKVLGTAGDPRETLSQAVFVDALLPMITRQAQKDRDLLKRGRKPPRATPAEEGSLVFRDMFLDGRDAEIARLLWNYFGAVEDRWGEYWREVRRGYVLNRTTGFRALMSFLPYAYRHLGPIGAVPSRDDFGTVLRRVRLEGSDITPENYPPGSSGQRRLRDHLLSDTGLG